MTKKSYKERYLKTSDGIKIAINHFETNKEAVLIIANGWTMCKESLFIKDISKLFAKTFDVISFDFRGHGKSSGIYTFTSKETEDLKSVVNYANKNYKTVYLLGFSLGGAISIIHSANFKNIDPTFFKAFSVCSISSNDSPNPTIRPDFVIRFEFSFTYFRTFSDV